MMNWTNTMQRNPKASSTWQEAQQLSINREDWCRTTNISYMAHPFPCHIIYSHV